MRFYLQIFVCVVLFFCLNLNVSVAQECEFTGSITDYGSEDGLAFANVFYKDSQGFVADVNGDFSVVLPYGKYEFEFTFVGYISKLVTVELNRAKVNLDLALLTMELDEALVLADIAIDRETPVAFSNIDIRTINEELASQDIPMILNSTPGVYATQQGGGDGDARITIRGFSQRNVAVLLDGVPVNDMENGAVYWSNWFGLDAIMQTTQVQRGLGISKLAVPSVGGTINIITKGIEQKKATQIKQEVANNGFLRTTLGHTSGRLKGGWGFTVAGSYKQGDGWVDGNWTQGVFYYGKVQKALGNHIFTLSGFGAPQSHGQRSFSEGVHIYDHEYSRDLGVDPADFPEYGLNFNIHAGQLTRYDLDQSGNKINEKSEDLNERKNYYHKPQFTFKHSWAKSDRLSFSNVAYLSVGKGGGTFFQGNAGTKPDGSPNFQRVYDIQTGYSYDPENDPNGIGDPSIIPQVSLTRRAATQGAIYTNFNNHFWYGLLSSFSFKKNENWNYSGGLDIRHYKGGHYREVYDLLGADYVLNKDNPNSSFGDYEEGDKVDFNNDNLVGWAGAFGQVEYKNEVWSGFFSGSYAMTRYKRIDYFLPKSATIDGFLVEPGYGWGSSGTPVPDEIIAPNGQVYTPDSPELSYQETDWFYKGGYTFKTGFNRKLNEYHNAYVNLGYLSLAPRFDNIYYRSNDLLSSIENEKVQSFELGYGYKKNKVSVSFNSYLTIWENRPFPGGIVVPDPNDNEVNYRANINGMDARHMGAELEAALALSKKLTLEGIVSIGDWIWNSKDTVFIFDNSGRPVIDLETGIQESRDFDARGVHVGDAAQTQLGGLIRYEFKRGAYLKLRYTYFDRYFANFNPTELNGSNVQRESWQIPSYSLVDLHMGYRISFPNKKALNLRASILNLLDKVYVSDARDSFSLARFNDYSITESDNSVRAQGFDAGSAGVFFGQGTRFNISATLNF